MTAEPPTALGAAGDAGGDVRRGVGRFAIEGALPGPGITVIEASAGTGKTWTLTSLVVRFVAEGLALSQILAVTFTRMATAQLRDRVRRRLRDAHRDVSARLAGLATDDDPLVDVLCAGDPEEVARRARRLAAALADFDASTIATTHGFCQMVLQGLGSAGDAPAEARVLEDPRDLVRQVADELYLRRCVEADASGVAATPAGRPPAPGPGPVAPDRASSSGRYMGGTLPFDPAAARKAAVAAVANSDTELFAYTPGSRSAALADLAGEARREVTRRLVADGCLTYDEMLSRLARTLDSPVRGPEAVRRLSGRYQVVLVDEFQDTDPVQWRIVRTAFAGPADPCRLVLIGDPKQAIYSFRGADVHTYLEAAADATRMWTLGECRRSDQPLLDAVAALFEPTLFGHPGIPFRRVAAAAGRQAAALPGPSLRFRVVADSDPATVKTARKRYHQKDSLVSRVAADVAGDIDRFLVSAPAVPDGPGGPRELHAGDIAVLTLSNRQALLVRDALRQRGVPAVVGGSDSVFGSEAARDWLLLFDAIQEPTSRSRLSGLALSPFVGMRPLEVVRAGEEVWERLHDQVQDWTAALAAGGAGSLLRTVSAATGLPARLLAHDDGERVITDLSQVAELLHAEGGLGRVGPAALRGWLAARIKAAGDDDGLEERSRRLDSDAAAVQVLTVHRAKGLEFDVVYCPYLWDAPSADGGGSVVYHDPGHGRRQLDIGCTERSGPDSADYRAHVALADTERQGESLRLMYVALTRARHRVVVWWGRAHRSGTSPLARVLLWRDPTTGAVGPAREMEPDEASVAAAMVSVRDRAPFGAVSVEAVRARPPAEEVPGSRPGHPVDLDVARFERVLDQSWRRASYTSITAVAHGSGEAVSSEAEVGGITDEPADSDLDAHDGAGDPAVGGSAVAGVGGSAAAGVGGSAVAGVGGSAAAGVDGSAVADVGGSPVADVGGSAVIRTAWDAIPGGRAIGTVVHRALELTDFAADPLEPAVAAAVEHAHRFPQPGLDPARLAAALIASLTTPLGGPLAGDCLTHVVRPDRLDELAFELPVAGGDRPSAAVTTADIAGVIGRHIDPGAPLGRYAERLADPAMATKLRGYLVGSLDLVFRRPPPSIPGCERWYVVDYKTNRLGPSEMAITSGQYGPPELAAEMVHRHYPLQALMYMVALHRYLQWRRPGYRPDRHLGGVYYLFLRGMNGPDTPTLAGQVCGSFYWDVPPALVIELSDLIAGGSRP